MEKEEITLETMQCIEFSILKTIKAICDENGLEYYLIGGTLLGAIRHSGFIPWDDDIDIALPREDYDELESRCRLYLPEHYGWIDYKDDYRLPYHYGKVYDKRTILIEQSREGYQVPLGVYVDVFPLDGVPRSILQRQVHYSWVQLLRAMLIINYVDNDRRRIAFKRMVISLGHRVLSESLIRDVHELLEKAVRKYGYDSSEEICNYFGSYGRNEIFPKGWVGSGASTEFEGVHLKIFAEYDKYLRRIYGDCFILPPLEQRKSNHQFEVYGA